MALYAVSRNNADSDQPFLTRMMSKYAEAEEKRTRRNDIHVRMIEQAGEDRVLFANSRPQEYVDMRFPEYVLVWPTANPPSKIPCHEMGIRTCHPDSIHKWESR